MRVVNQIIIIFVAVKNEINMSLRTEETYLFGVTGKYVKNGVYKCFVG